jgi:hypothetical protein
MFFLPWQAEASPQPAKGFSFLLSPKAESYKAAHAAALVKKWGLALRKRYTERYKKQTAQYIGSFR